MRPRADAPLKVTTMHGRVSSPKLFVAVWYGAEDDGAGEGRVAEQRTMALSVRAAGHSTQKGQGQSINRELAFCRRDTRRFSERNSPVSSKRLAQGGEHGHLDPPATPRLAVSLALALASTPESDIRVASEGRIGRSAGGTERGRDERVVKRGQVVVCVAATAINSRER